MARFKFIQRPPHYAHRLCKHFKVVFIANITLCAEKTGNVQISDGVQMKAL